MVEIDRVFELERDGASTRIDHDVAVMRVGDLCAGLRTKSGRFCYYRGLIFSRYPDPSEEAVLEELDRGWRLSVGETTDEGYLLVLD